MINQSVSVDIFSINSRLLPVFVVDKNAALACAAFFHRTSTEHVPKLWQCRQLCSQQSNNPAAGAGHPGWETFAGLRAHVDAHILGQLPGAVPADWLRARDMVSCRECSRLVSRRCNGGVHRTCAADRMQARPQPQHLPGSCSDSDLDVVLQSLPSLDNIFAAPVGTRDFVSAALLPSAQKEFLKCILQVLQHNSPDAWTDPGGARDTVHYKRCRLAWLELFMFCKTCLSVLPGGAAKRRRNHNISSNRLERWALGERRSLWDEAVRHAGGRPTRMRTDEEKQQAARLVAEQYARRGMPGKAVQRLAGPPVAAPTAATIAAMQAKFPPRPPHQQDSRRPAAPAANELSCTDVLQAVRSFPRGAAPGPTGMRPDFLKQVVDTGTEQYGAQVLTDLVTLL